MGTDLRGGKFLWRKDMKEGVEKTEEDDKGTAALGKLVADHTINQLIDAIKAIKSDDKTLKLQKEFFDRVRK